MVGQAADMVAVKSTGSARPSSTSVRPRIREIADINPVINLLVRGFPRPRRYWGAVASEVSATQYAAVWLPAGGRGQPGWRNPFDLKFTLYW